jgi:DNA-directed RNA polymerase specialized sigma24 family protein
MKITQSDIDYVKRALGRKVWSAKPEDIEDAVAEGLLTAWSGRRRFNGDSSTTTWLVSISFHKYLLHQRTNQRRITREQRAEYFRRTGCYVSTDEYRSYVK